MMLHSFGRGFIPVLLKANQVMNALLKWHGVSITYQFVSKGTAVVERTHSFR